jgi:TRAP-type mannitol/chloroaromatic compound transport system permease small subunit
MQRLIFLADQLSTFVGKAFAWLIGLLMVLVCVEVLKRYILNMPAAWVFDASSMLYGG